jgi:NADPH-dependent glutamate synthase beta subunit-like oxidoreductase/CO/xanthine dehydrogenase FAD-binding subunit
MREFKHINVKSPQTASAALEKCKGAAVLIAGGTDILGILKDEVHPVYPQVLVNIKTIEGMDQIVEDSQGMRIGALVKLDALDKNPLIKTKYPALSQAAHAVASPQIRKMGTIGGNICQEPRCWYYRMPDNFFYCTRKDGKFCNALVGENRYHSIFGAMRVGETPCSAGCPAHVEIPAYMSLVREGKLNEAAALLLEANPIPAITGRVCPHYCEQECNRGQYDEAVSVRSVERFLGDFILDHAPDFIRPPETETGKSVAVLGSGPAGLAAAYYLRRMGHTVTVFERMSEAGGMLTYAIPPYRLPKEVVRRVVKAFEAIGIEFRLKIEIGKDMKLEDLQKDYDSVFLATGAWRQPSIGLDGEKLTRSGLEFLSDMNSGKREKPGRRVLVIGGGNVAVDVGLTAKRLGAEEVTLACLESREEMPAFENEIEQGLEEGIRLMTSWGPLKVTEENGEVTGMEMVRCTSVFDANGAFRPTFNPDVKTKVEADQIILAVGQRTELQYLEGVNVHTGRELILIDEENQQTNFPGVFAGGDVTIGPASVVEAIAAGRTAAQGIDRALVGNRELESVEKKDAAFLHFDSQEMQTATRTPMAGIPLDERSIDIEDMLGFTPSEMEMEARRCFNCGCVAVSPSDIAPALIALDAKIRTTRRTIAAESFFEVGKMSSTVLDPDELVTEIYLPAPGEREKQAFLKFRLRNSIDFPILAVAAVVHKDGSGRVSAARVVLGAAAPVPLRLREVETYLIGKELSAETAEAAAEIAVDETCSLARNEYKIQIARALVRRALVAVA